MDLLNKKKLSEESICLLRELQAAADETGQKEGTKKQPEEYVFLNLLGGISACRKMPGIPQHMGYEGIYQCEDEANAKLLREALHQMFGIADMESLHNALGEYECDREFRDFYSFWREYPAFDIRQLNPEGKKAFTTCMEFASQLYPFTKSKGFKAWDINEKIGLCRRAYACGIISQEQYQEQSDSYLHMVSAFFDNWGEYAMSCVCGAAYWMYVVSGYNMEEAERFLKLNQELALTMLRDNGAWNRYGWLKMQTKKYAISSSEMLDLLPKDYTGDAACFISDRITVDGMKVGYMYREEPEKDMPDSGWRFLAGDEDDVYMNNSDNLGIYHLNTACNYDMDIIPLLNRSYGTAYVRDKRGRFIEVQDS